MPNKGIKNRFRVLRQDACPAAQKKVTDTFFQHLQPNRTRRQIVKREIIRVEPFDSNFEKWGAPVSTCTRAGDMVFISGMPPFDPKTGELLVNAPFEQQAERILEQLKTVLEAAGSDLEHVMKINVLCVSPERFKAFNEIYKRYFPNNPPARIFFCVPVWTGPFDIEIECIAVRKD
jgi:2-iminobutanoate/2-iminopropanoate deaminase